MARSRPGTGDSLGAMPLSSGQRLLRFDRRLDLLRVVQQRQRTHPVALQELVVEQHAGDDERPGERAASGLVGACDEPGAEPAVVLEEALAGSLHAADDSAPSGRRPRT